MMRDLWPDLKHSLRSLARRPGFTLVAVLTLALGIGANSAIFSFVKAILLTPLPIDEPSRVVAFCGTDPGGQAASCSVSPRDVEDWARASRAIETFGPWRDWGFTLKGEDGAVGVSGGIASPGLFEALRLKAEAGRLFLPQDDQPGRNHVVVISHGCWRSRFGGDPRIVGQVLTLDNEPFEVIGVLPASFELPSLSWIDVWAPVSIDPDQAKGRWLRNRQVWARLAPGVTIGQARSEMSTIAEGLARQYPDTNAGRGVALEELHEHEVGSARMPLLLFLGAVGFVLIIACVNVSNLLLSLAAERRRELAIRAAVGAGRPRLVRLLLAESLLLALAGGAAGLLLALWATDLFVALSPGNLPRLHDVRIDAGVFAFTFALSALTGVLFGVLPALHSSRFDLVEALKPGRSRLLGWSGPRLRGLLLVTEIALALVLLIGAGLLLQSFQRLAGSQLGFDPDDLLTLQLFPSMARYPDRARVNQLYDEAARQIGGLPSVLAVGLASSGPLFGGRETIELTIDGAPEPAAGQRPAARYANVSPDYFRAMGIPLLRGRALSESDDARSAPVAVINDTMARRYWPGQDPVGRLVRLFPDGQSVQVVGVVADVRRLQPADEVEPEIYWPYRQQPRWAAYLVVRTSGDPQRIVAAVRGRLKALDADLLTADTRTMTQIIARTLRRPRFNTELVAAFSAVALILTAVGTYGVASCGASQRTQEIGVRMALGAQRSDILRLVMREALAHTIAGIGIGMGAALALTRLMSGLLYEVRPADPATFAGMTLFLASVSCLAAYVPAMRATRLDPLSSLRCE